MLEGVTGSGRVAGDELQAARERLAEAASVCVVTGAGISAESGVPTFRGEEGLWKSHRPEELATPQAFDRDPRVVWEWYDMRRRLIGDCVPNAGHRAMAEWMLGRAGQVTLATQNVDGLHEMAAVEAAGAEGDPSPAIPLELHGSIFRVRCTGCGEERSHRDPIDPSGRDTLPRCSACASLLRPAVVWFGEGLDPESLDRAFEAASRADVALVVGTSAVVHPAASIPMVTVREGGTLIEVNPEETPLSRAAAFSLRGSAGEILPALLSNPAYAS